MDKVSRLPDELLVKVLTFLPTKEAVSTSILSKRWEHLWMWLPKLEYDDQHYSESERKRLRCFIVRSLPLHKAHVIESLRFKLSNSHYFKPQVIKWIVATAVSRNVLELDISCSSYPEKLNILPSNLYTSKSLVILKLERSLKERHMDKISKLPDELIAKVLTFLPTKEAVSTSILSKRWEHLWMWLPKLEYDDQHYSESERKRLRCFIVRSLPLHKAHVIESLRLKLSNSHYFKPQVIKWIVATAVSRKYVSWISLTMITPEFLE
ncbi:hypothetical protein DY000_02017406 [Brassica cretica]|uniref:F-box domain-containing protein n=1 Tax=Brassica cretica TaxID=69181 RepID=A0ABQ7D3N1_BRACR|nr:hypothetical protein DY000_02017406 [Brassica cretica]